MKKICFTFLALIALVPLSAQTTATFEDLSLPADSFWNGSGGSGGFLDGSVYFKNVYNTTYQSFSGFAYSNKIDTITAGYANQFSCAAGGGANGSATFAVAYAGTSVASTDAIVRLQGSAIGHQVYGIYVTNSTYDYLSMKNGDQFAKKFGGVTGSDPDWFRVTIGGWYNGSPIANTLDVYLADFRSADTTQHYILHTWKFVNLQSLGNVDSLSFILSSTDTAGGFGMNTPAYFCLDNLTTTSGVIANNDTALTSYHDSVIVNVLANDSFVRSSPYTVTITSGPQVPGASAYLDANNALVYIPAIGIRTVDTVTYSLCNQSSVCFTANVLITIYGDTNTAINEIDETSLRLYPNPANAGINISSESVIRHVSLIDMSGREVLAMDMDKKSAYISVDTLSSGLYTAVIHTNAGIATRRFIKE